METTSEVDTMLKKKKELASIELIHKTSVTWANREAFVELRKKTSKGTKAESELAISVHLN